MDTFYLSIPRATNSSDDSSSLDDEDSDLEVTSIFDEEDSELIRMGDGLHLVSDDSDDELPILNHSTLSNGVHDQSSGDDEIADPDVSIQDSSPIGSICENETSGTPSQKRKRRAWSIREKLRAIENYEKSHSKHLTAKAMGCTRFQLSEWVKRRDDLKNLQSSKQGKLVNDKNPLCVRLTMDSLSCETLNHCCFSRCSTKETQRWWKEIEISGVG